MMTSCRGVYHNLGNMDKAWVFELATPASAARAGPALLISFSWLNDVVPL
jgi:hypothetical protein